MHLCMCVMHTKCVEKYSYLLWNKSLFIIFELFFLFVFLCGDLNKRPFLPLPRFACPFPSVRPSHLKHYPKVHLIDPVQL